MIMPILLVAFLLVATLMDVKWRRVKNWWILCGIIAGFFLTILSEILSSLQLQIIPIGAPGLFCSFLGFILPLPLLILYALGHLGAGDIKLLMVAGIFLGDESLRRCLIPTILAAGVMAAAYILISFIKRKNIYLIMKSRLPLAGALLLGVCIELMIT